MSVLALPRQGGKTTLLIGASLATGRTIVCATKSRVENVEALARKYGAVIPRPVSARSFLRASRGCNDMAAVLVDDAKAVLETLLGVPVQIITATK